MHDPMTVAHEIKYPWFKGSGEFRYRPSIITIWHVDPQRDGSDDSCDWFNHKRQLTPELKLLREATWDMETLLDNRPHFPDSREHKTWQPLHAAIMTCLRQPSRTHWWQLHPRWHIWHWRIQVHPLQVLKRRLFTRCSGCGKRFVNGQQVFSGSWNNDGPRWFKSEANVYHDHCFPIRNWRRGHYSRGCE